MSLQAKFCSTVANDVMLDTDVGVVRMWADETSRLSRFRMLFTSFADRESHTEVIPHFAPCDPSMVHQQRPPEVPFNTADSVKIRLTLMII